MGTIQTSIGPASGINSGQIIEQLLQIEARPRALAQRRLVQIQSQQAAILDLNSAVLSLTQSAEAFNLSRLFSSSTATSTNPDAITATASPGASVGSYDFVVDRLVTTDSRISRGFANRDSTGLGLDQLAFEVGGGRLDADTDLETLNGGLGVDRGKISITDSNGDSATVDLSRAVTVSDVLDAINGASGVAVTASVDGYGLRVTDDNGGALEIKDVFGSSTATSLGLRGDEAGGTISSGQLLSIGENTALSTLNDGNGISFGPGGQAAPADFRINVDGTNYNIVLGELGSLQPDPDDPDTDVYTVDEPAVSTVGELLERIESQTGGAVEARVSADGAGIELAAAGSTITVSKGPTGSSTAVDLGFVDRGATTNNDDDVFASRTLLAGINSRLASSLAGGAGIASGSVAFTTADGSAFIADIDGDASVSDLIAEINDASGGAVTATLNGAGNGLLITDNTSGGGQLAVADVSSTAAADLGIATTGADGSVDSGNLQTRFVSEGTLLGDLRGGQGVGTGSFRVTDSSGTSSTVTIDDSVRTVRDLLAKINGAAADVTASINENGDGIVIADSAGGANAISIENASGTVATNLGIAGTADTDTGPNQIVGSAETVVEFDAGDTLQDVVNAINDSGANVRASIVSSGAGPTPHRLVITSEASGAKGRVNIDTFGEDLGFQTLTRGRDAVAFFGSPDPASGFLVTSRTNTLDDVVEGVTFNLVSSSDQPAQVNVDRDIAAIEEGFTAFTEAFNKVVDRIDFHTRFNEDTGERGALLGDATPLGIKSTLTRLVLTDAPGVTGQYTNLTQIGLTVGEGGKVEFDSAKFREAYQDDPQAVRDLVSAVDAVDADEEVPVLDENGDPIPGATTTNTGPTEYNRLGVLENIARYTESLTDFVDGRLTRRKNTFDNQIQLQEDRISNLTEQLASKRAQLEQEFLAMERAIASLQTQQQALGQIG